jgi:hypothetical protein
MLSFLLITNYRYMSKVVTKFFSLCLSIEVEDITDISHLEVDNYTYRLFFLLELDWSPFVCYTPCHQYMSTAPPIILVRLSPSASWLELKLQPQPHHISAIPDSLLDYEHA